MMKSDRQETEQRQWDELAVEFARSAESDLIVESDHPDITSHLRKSLALLGNVEGKRVLECGCGTGVTSVMLAKMGAEILAFDISRESVALANRRAEANGVAERVRAAQMPFENLDFPDGHFDLAFGNMVLHHVDADSAGKELSRVLKPGGRAIFAETSGRNKLLMLARSRLAGRLGIARNSTDGEKPLDKAELEALARHFSSATEHFVEFLFFTTACTNVLKWRKSTRLLQRALLGLDGFVFRRLSFLRQYSYLMVVELVK